MDIFLSIMAILLVILGIIGAVLPVLPSSPLAWAGILVFSFTNYDDFSVLKIVILLVIAVIVYLLQYIIPAWGVKKFGGSKYSVWGSTIGLLIGLFFPPLGFIILPFLGAFVAEILFTQKDTQASLKAAWGSFIGFLVSTLLNFIYAFWCLWEIVKSFF